MAGNKGIVPSNFYTFNAANQTITFSNDYAGLDLGEITYITNIKNGVATVIYDPFDATKGGTLNGLTLTLAYNTTTMGNTDPLQVIVGFTPLNADPTPVKIVSNIYDEDQIEILQNISDNLDLLSKTVDQAEGIQIEANIKNIKKDNTNAIIRSDAPKELELQKIFRSTNEAFIIDTTGYNTVVFLLYTNANTNAQVQLESSIDGNIWIAVPYTFGSATNAASFTAANTPAFIGSGANYVFSCNPIGKFIRLRATTVSAGTFQVICQLRNTLYGIHSAAGASQNMSAIAGATPQNALANLSTLGTTTAAGTLSVAGAFTPTTNPPNANSTLATSVPSPQGIGGREQPYIGALGGLFRYITVDGGGRYILGGDTPDTETRTQSKRADGSISGIPPRGVGAISNNFRGAQSLTVADTSQDFGDTQVMLLRQILTELKILNQQFHEMPNLLNQANFTMSDPQEYRNDGDFDSSLQ